MARFGKGRIAVCAASGSGSVTRFTFSMGPEPERLPGKEGVWVSGGDQFFLNTSETRKGTASDQARGLLRHL